MHLAAREALKSLPCIFWAEGHHSRHAGLQPKGDFSNTPGLLAPSNHNRIRERLRRCLLRLPSRNQFTILAKPSEERLLSRRPRSMSSNKQQRRQTYKRRITVETLARHRCRQDSGCFSHLARRHCRQDSGDFPLPTSPSCACSMHSAAQGCSSLPCGDGPPMREEVYSGDMHEVLLPKSWSLF